MEVQRCVLYFVLIAVAAAARGEYFRFEDCSKQDAIAHVSKFRIREDPVDLSRNMTVDMLVEILRDVPPEAVLRTRYYKLKSLFGVHIDIPIPCLLGKFGSCTLSLCEYLKTFRDQVEPFFSSYRQYGCPVLAGAYGQEGVNTVIPDMSLVARIIVQGRYRTELRLLDSRHNGRELACYNIWVEIR